VIINRMLSITLDIQRQIRNRRKSITTGKLPFAIMGLVAMAMFSTAPIVAQQQGGTAASGMEKSIPPKDTVKNFARVSFNPSNMRDPFLNPLLKKKEVEGDREIDRGLPPHGIAGTFIAEAELKGISIRSNSRLAIVKGSGNRAYFLREGDRLFDGYLKTIHRDSITLVRETKMRSGKVMAQEVTKKLRTP
jgi:hypothetical protein